MKLKITYYHIKRLNIHQTKEQKKLLITPILIVVYPMMRNIYLNTIRTTKTLIPMVVIVLTLLLKYYMKEETLRKTLLGATLESLVLKLGLMLRNLKTTWLIAVEHHILLKEAIMTSIKQPLI